MTSLKRGSVKLAGLTGALLMVGAANAEAVTIRYYPVASGYQLNARSGPGTSYSVVRVLPEGSMVHIYCQTPGTTVTGPYGTSNTSGTTSAIVSTSPTRT